MQHELPLQCMLTAPCNAGIITVLQANATCSFAKHEQTALELSVLNNHLYTIH